MSLLLMGTKIEILRTYPAKAMILLHNFSS
jgi:hypothetical protein